MKTRIITYHIILSILFINNTLFAQFQSDTIITSEYFGFDYWGASKTFWAEVYTQMESDTFPFDLVGTDAINWQKIEPYPPVNGVHSYNWGAVDTLVWYTQMAGKKLDIGIRPLSNWGTVLKADSVPINDWALVMSPILPDSLSDTANWGMTAKQAWKEFIYNFVERYDGDAIGHPALPIDSDMIKTLTMGNEVEAPGHFFPSDSINPHGTIAKYKEIQYLTYDTAKYANPNLIVVRGKSNPGHIFDDKADFSIVYNRRQDFFDSITVDLSYGPDYYDMYTFNYNDHYTELSGYSDWVKTQMSAQGFSKPFMVGDSRTTLFPRDNFETGPAKLMPSIYTFDDTLLIDTNSVNYEQLKMQWRKDKVQQSIKKLVIAGATGMYQISLQPVYVVTDFHQGNPRTFMWMYSGFFDPYIYDQTNNLAPAREPLYWSCKMFANEVMGANKQAEDLNLGNHIYAYRYIKQSGDNPIIIWHENHFKTDQNTGLLLRNQDTVINMSSVFATQYVRIKHFITEVDNDGLPINIEDSIVSVNSVPLNEFPVILYPSNVSTIINKKSDNIYFEVYPNPTIYGYLFIKTNYKRSFNVEIIDVEGKIIKRKKCYGTTDKIDLHNIQKGSYVIKINYDKTISKKIIIE